MVGARRHPRPAVLVGSAMLAVGLVAGLPGPATSATVPPDDPSQLGHLGTAQQVVVVSGRGWTSSYAVLRAWRRQTDGSWRLVGEPVRARVGRHGFAWADRRRQNSGTSPAGTFAVRSAFGNGPDPGTALPYRHADGNDWWTYDPRDPRTYNVLQPRRPTDARWRTAWAEHLAAFGGQYRYVAVLDFNLPQGVHRAADGERIADVPADTRLGGGIFLHVSGPGATAGCVSVPRAQMRRLLRWLDPAAQPVLVMGPRSAMSRL